MLDSTERDIVIRHLRDNVFATANAVPILQMILGADLAAKAPVAAVSTSQGVTEIVVQFCESQDWRRQGDHPLIDLLDQVRSFDPVIPKMIQRLRAIPLPPDAFRSEILDRKSLFLGREKLRGLVPELLSETGYCVLRINGDVKAGKSYSFRFLKFLSTQKKPLVPILFECPGSDTPAITVAKTLALSMATAQEGAPQLDNETPLRRGTFLATWVLNLALRDRSVHWWFVLDNFDNDSLPDDTKEFIRQLALQIANGIGSDSLRLILINYKAKLPRELRNFQTEEVVPLDRPEWLRLLTVYYNRLADAVEPAKRQTVLDARDSMIDELNGVSDAEFLLTLCEAVEDDTRELAPA